MTNILIVSTDGHRNFAKALHSEVRKHCGISATSLNLHSDCEGDFSSLNFFNACYTKICSIINMLSTKNGGFLIYLDADICVKGNISAEMKRELGSNHIAFQRDGATFCAGMFICKICPEVLNFFKTVQSTLENNKEYYLNRACDQGAINELLPVSGLNYCFLSDNFTTYGNIVGGLWTPLSPPFILKNTVLAFHANYTIGLENKKILLEYVRSL